MTRSQTGWGGSNPVPATPATALLILEGGGDLMVTAVSEDVFAWICRTDTPGRKGDESSWLDSAAPEAIVEAHKRAGDVGVYVTIGSYENERMRGAGISDGGVMRIFDISNKARVGFWCAAPDAETAKDIALAAGHAKKREHLRATDVTEGFRELATRGHTGVESILSGTKTGRVIGRGQSYTMAEVLAGVKKAKTHWEVV